MQPASTPKTLLRRTAVALLAAASLISLPASSAKITFSGAGAGENCDYSSMQVDPAGNVAVSCSAAPTGGNIGSGGGTTQPPPTGPDTFTLSAPVSTVATSGTFTAVITRTGVPSSGPVGINLAVIGACSSTAVQNAGGGTITAQPTDAGPFNIPITASATLGTCTILYNIGYGGAATSGVTQLNIPVTTTTTQSGGPPPGGSNGGGGSGTLPVVAGCPTAPANAVMGTFPPTPGTHMPNDGTAHGYWIEPTTVVTAIPLPTLPAGIAQGSVQLTYGSRTYGDPSMTEIAISKCPGVIDPSGTTTLNSGSSCYYGSSNPANAALFWYARNSTRGSLAILASRGNCTADETQGTWYANIRYTYTNCNSGLNQCGQQIQWNKGGT